jgi:hypothetical protein
VLGGILRKAGYFILAIVSKQALSDAHQLAVIIRYVSPDDVFLIEFFLPFLELENHTDENKVNKLLDYLSNDCKVDFIKCQGHMIM